MEELIPEKADTTYKANKVGVAVVAAGLATLAAPGAPALVAAGLTAGAVELLSLVLTPPLEKRRDKWFASLAEKLQQLEQKIDDFSIQNLAEDEQFITTLIHATQIAARNHKEEKLVALKNAVINSAIPNSMKDDLEIIFLNFIDKFTGSHIQVLNVLYSQNSCEMDEDFFGDNKPILTQVVRDLEYMDLIKIKNNLISRNLDSVNEKRANRLLDEGKTKEAIKILTKEGEKIDDISSFLKNVKTGYSPIYRTEMGEAFFRFIQSPLNSAKS